MSFTTSTYGTSCLTAMELSSGANLDGLQVLKFGEILAYFSNRYTVIHSSVIDANN